MKGKGKVGVGGIQDRRREEEMEKDRNREGRWEAEAGCVSGGVCVNESAVGQSVETRGGRRETQRV